MKHDLDIVDPLVLKLGPTVREWKAISKVEYDLIGRAFELAGFESINFGRLRGITEADCRQVTLELDLASRPIESIKVCFNGQRYEIGPLTSPQEAHALSLKVTRVRTMGPDYAFTTWVKT